MGRKLERRDISSGEIWVGRKVDVFHGDANTTELVAHMAALRLESVRLIDEQTDILLGVHAIRRHPPSESPCKGFRVLEPSLLDLGLSLGLGAVPSKPFRSRFGSLTTETQIGDLLGSRALILDER